MIALKTIKKFDKKKFIRIYNEVLESGYFEGHEVIYKSELDRTIAEKIICEPNTVAHWRGNKEPGAENIKKLEKLFGVSFYKEIIVEDTDKEENTVIEEIKEGVSMQNYSDFTKQQIQMAYSEMKKYIRSKEVDSEDRYIEMEQKLDELKVSIPRKLYCKITNFKEKYLSPIIYDREEIFNSVNIEGVGSYTVEGKLIIQSKAEGYKIIAKTIEILIDIERKLDDFAMKELYPILVM